MLPFLEKGSSAATAAATAGSVKLDTAGQFESVVYEIDLNGFCPFHEFFVHQVGETINIENVIGIFGLIQSHCKGGPASTAFV